MVINSLSLSNYRNFKDKKLTFSPKTTVIIGPNASGKTNILESIFLLSSGKSFHARIEEEMVNYEGDIARVRGSIVSGEDEARIGINLEVVLTRGEVKIESEKIQKTQRKKLLVNGVSRRLLDFTGNLRAVLFGPWDMELVTDSPSIRRKFLDTVLSLTDREYRRASLSYEKGLRQRNRILWNLRENPSTSLRTFGPSTPYAASTELRRMSRSGRSQLLFWDRLLIKNGDYISRKREEFIDFVNKSQIKISKSKLNGDFSLEYDKSAISEARLEQYAEEEVAAATTLVGPHRDDFIFRVSEAWPAKPVKEYKSIRVKDRELARYGSRGEQRMGVLWLKLAELAYIEDQSGEKPVLLLDDIFSELDHEHRDVVSESTKDQQTIITTADPHFIEGFKSENIIEI